MYNFRKKLFVAILTFCISSVSPGYAADYQVKKNTVEFLIDTSGSMKGDKIREVKKAFNAILDSIPQGIEIGVITFSSKVNVLVPLTVDKELLKTSVSNLQASGETAIFDALQLALQSAINNQGSRIVLLTDGEDTVSNSKLSDITQKAMAKTIPIDLIGLQTTLKQGETLQKIADASGGEFYSLMDLNQLILAYKKSLSSIIQTPSEETSPATPSENSNSKSNFQLQPFLISFSAFFLIIFLYLVLRQIARRTISKKRRWEVLQKYDLRRLGPSSAIKNLRNFDYEKIPNPIKNWILGKLDLIHSEIKFEKVVNILLIVFLITTIIFTWLFKNLFVSIIFATLATPTMFNIYIKNKRQTQVRQFADELPEFLNIVASALKSGLTLGQGLEAFSLENKGEVARQIRRATSEIQMGSTIEDSLMNIAIRMENEDLKWTVTALSIQRNVGGSFASILSTTHVTVKERAEIRREVRTLSAEGKLSAYILMALPLGIFFFLFLTKRDYVSIFWTKFEGIFLLGIIGSNLTIGWLWIKKIIEIKI